MENTNTNTTASQEPQCPPVPDALIDKIHSRFHTRREAAQRGANWGFTQALAAAQRLAGEERQRLEELEAWKASAMAVEREWDPNAIAQMLGGRLGESQRACIQREVPRLVAKAQELESENALLRQQAAEERQRGADEELEACIRWLGMYGLGPNGITRLHAARRPPAPTKREQALALIPPVGTQTGTLRLTPAELAIVRQALEEAGDER